MSKPKPPTLGAVAAAEDETKKRKKAAGLFANALALLGIGTPDAKTMRKVTEKHTHVKLEEEEGGSESGAEEEEEGGSEGSMSTGSTGSDGGSTGSTHPSEEEEEEGEAEEEEKHGGGKMEEEEEARARGLSRAVSKALNSAEVQAAFLAALPEKYRAEGALLSPHRFAAYAKKATGAKTTYGAMMALADGKKRATSTPAADTRILRAQAGLEKRVAKVETSRRKERVAAIVNVAKERGVAGATTHEGREMLRAYGMQHGTAQLTAFLATQPKVARTTADGGRVPKIDGKGNVLGAPDASTQITEMAMADLSPEAREEYAKARAKIAASKANGAAPKGGY